MSATVAGNQPGSRDERRLSGLVLVVGVCLVVVGAVAVFVSSNSSGTAALLAAGAALTLCIVFRDRLQKAKIGGFEIELAVRVKDQLRTALELRVKGNYEESELEIQRAFDRFVAELDAAEYYKYDVSKQYHQIVYDKLQNIVQQNFGGTVQNTSATDSFFPLVDAVLRLDGNLVQAELSRRNLMLCPDLREHLSEGELTVGVTIRPGPNLNAHMLAERLKTNVQHGALSATCFLLIQNCRDELAGSEFRSLARRQGMHASSAVWAAEGTEHELDIAIGEAILTVCSDQLDLAARAPSPIS